MLDTSEARVGLFLSYQSMSMFVTIHFFQIEPVAIFLASVSSMFGLFNMLNIRFGRTTSRDSDGNNMLRFCNKAHLIITYTRTVQKVAKTRERIYIYICNFGMHDDMRHAFKLYNILINSLEAVKKFSQAIIKSPHKKESHKRAKKR